MIHPHFYPAQPYSIPHRWPVLLVSFNTIIACLFVASTFKPPEKQPFPSLFPRSNPYEAHSKFVENLVAYPLQFVREPEWAVQAVFGVQAIDNGNKLDPDPTFPGSVVYDDDFNAANNQMYLMEFCDKIEKPTEDYNCVLKDFDSWLQLQSLSTSPDDEYISNCDEETSVPTQANTFDQCIFAFSELTNSSAITFDNEAKKVKSIVIDTRVDSTLWSPPAEVDEDWHLIEDWSATERSRAPEGANKFFISSLSFWYVNTYNNIVSSGLKAACIVVVCATLVILMSSRSLLLSLFSIISILYVLVAATASLVSLGWNLGLFESILFAILVGLGSDFIMHFAHAYSMIPGKVDKRVRMNHAISHMGPSVLGSAATTLSTALIMQFTRTTSPMKFATMMIMTVVHSLIGSFIIFSVLCLCFGPAEPTRRFDTIKTRVVNQLQKGEIKRVGTQSEVEVPQSIEIATDTDVSNKGSFHRKRRMTLTSYLVAATLIICINIEAYSFVKSSREPQIVESAFDVITPGNVVDEDAAESFDDVILELMKTFMEYKDRTDIMSTESVILQMTEEIIVDLQNAASFGGSQELQDVIVGILNLFTVVETLMEWIDLIFDPACISIIFAMTEEIIIDSYAMITASTNIDISQFYNILADECTVAEGLALLVNFEKDFIEDAEIMDMLSAVSDLLQTTLQTSCNDNDSWMSSSLLEFPDGCLDDSQPPSSAPSKSGKSDFKLFQSLSIEDIEQIIQEKVEDAVNKMIDGTDPGFPELI